MHTSPRFTAARLRTASRRGLAALAAGTVLVGAAYALGPGTASASSHREAPLIAADPAATTPTCTRSSAPNDPTT